MMLLLATYAYLYHTAIGMWGGSSPNFRVNNMIYNILYRQFAPVYSDIIYMYYIYILCVCNAPRPLERRHFRRSATISYVIRPLRGPLEHTYSAGEGEKNNNNNNSILYTLYNIISACI